MNAELIERAKNYVKEKFENEFSGHDYFHTVRVFHMATRIAIKEQADLNGYSLNAFIRENYSKGLNEKGLRELLEMELLATRYNEDFETKSHESVTKEQVEAMSLAEKMAETRKYREGEYEKLINAVYPKRGWTMNGVPTIEHLKKIGMDLPELIEIVAPLQDLEP